MPWHYPLLDRIASATPPRWAGHPSVEKAMGAAWESADATGRKRLIATLLRRSQPLGLMSLLRHYHQLDAGSRQQLCADIARLHAPLRHALTHAAQDPAAAFNALSIIEAAHEADLTYLVVEKLRDPQAPLRERAGQALRGLASGASGTTSAPRGHRDRLIESIDNAVLRYASHRHPDALIAWLTLGPVAPGSPGSPGNHAVAALDHADHEAVAPLRELLSGAALPEVRRGLVLCLGIPTLALAAVAGLRACLSVGLLHEAITEREHLLDLPAIRRGLARAGDASDLLPPDAASPTDTTNNRLEAGGETQATNLPGAQADLQCPALPAWMDALPLSTLVRAERLAALLDARTPAAPGATRLAALTRLLPLVESQQPDGDPRVVSAALPAIARCTHDAEPGIALLAAAWLMRQSDGARRFGRELLTSPHAMVQQRAARRLRESLRRAAQLARPEASTPVLTHFTARLTPRPATLQASDTR